MHAGRGDDWEVAKVALRDIPKALQFPGRVPVTIVPWQDVPDFSLSALEGDEALLAEMIDMKPADVAREHGSRLAGEQRQGGAAGGRLECPARGHRDDRALALQRGPELDRLRARVIASS